MSDMIKDEWPWFHILIRYPNYFFFLIDNKISIKKTQSAQIVHLRKEKL